MTFPLSGMLLHISMQNGLHIPMSSHEFSRVKIPAPSEADLVRRSELWAHTVIVYQRYLKQLHPWLTVSRTGFTCCKVANSCAEYV